MRLEPLRIPEVLLDGMVGQVAGGGFVAGVEISSIRWPMIRRRSPGSVV
jgi:hypothetical protein